MSNRRKRDLPIVRNKNGFYLPHLVSRLILERLQMERHYKITQKHLRHCLDVTLRSTEDKTIKLTYLLEARLDNVLRLLGLTGSVSSARLMLKRGFVFINSIKVTKAARLVKPGERIRVTIRQNAKSRLPPWLEWDIQDGTAVVRGMPDPSEVKFLNFNLVAATADHPDAVWQKPKFRRLRGAGTTTAQGTTLKTGSHKNNH